MTEVDTSPLQRFGKRRGVQAKEVWTPPTLDSFGSGVVIGIDQSLANCGVTVVYAAPRHLEVVDSVVLKTTQVAEGPEDSLLRAELMRQMLMDYLRGYESRQRVVHEMPLPIRPGMKGRRPEASWLAAQALRAAAIDQGHPITMMGAQHHKRVTCGMANADKIAHHAVLMMWAADLSVLGLHKVSNEDKRDGFSLALTALIDAREA